jgi:3-dehydroquinate dehydratase
MGERCAREIDPAAINDIATNGGAFPHLSIAEIDALCERLNQ